MSVAQNNRTNLFIRLRSWADDGSGLPIWWQLQYFGTTGVDPYGNPAGDGWRLSPAVSSHPDYSRDGLRVPRRPAHILPTDTKC